MTLNYPTYTQASLPDAAPSSTVAISPYVTGTFSGTFSSQSGGAFMGIAQNGPGYRYELSSACVSSQESKPLYGGLPIVSLISQTQGLPRQIRRATTVGEVTGFSVINDCPNLIVTANSNCPSIGAPGTINFFRLGSRAKIALPIDPALIDLVGQAESQSLSWDFSKNMLTAVIGTGDDGKKSSQPVVSLNVTIHEICPLGRLATEDGKGNINWTNVQDDASGRLLALVQI